jgi:NADH-quinone oxidoreductase subunit N
VSAVGAALTALAAWLIWPEAPVTLFGGMVRLDALTSVVTIGCAVGAGITALGSTRYLEAHGIDRGEYYALLLFATAGMSLMVGANDFIVLFLGLEIQAIALYALAAYQRRDPESAEGGLKYFMLGALGSALLVYGIALLYGLAGSTGYERIAAAMGPDDFATAGGLPLPVLGTMLVIVAFLVKLAAAPFHMWAPDAYTGAPTPAAGFLGGAAKLAGVAALGRLLATVLGVDALRHGDHAWTTALFYVALLSVVVGNVVGLAQFRVKRMLAWSSVSQAGYLVLALVALAADGSRDEALRNVVFYGVVYAIASAGAFAALGAFERAGRDVDTYDDLDGAGRLHPWHGLALAVFMLSAAGLPPTAGFVGKLSLFGSVLSAAGAGEGAGVSRLLVAAAVAGLVISVAGVWYYLKVIVHLFFKPTRADVAVRQHPATWAALLVAAVLTVWFGLVPGSLFGWSDKAGTEVAGMPVAPAADAAPVDEPAPATGGVPAVEPPSAR